MFFFNKPKEAASIIVGQPKPEMEQPPEMDLKKLIADELLKAIEQKNTDRLIQAIEALVLAMEKSENEMEEED